MRDFRYQPQDSPTIWCIHCQAYEQAERAVQVMRTVFKVDKHGLIPYGICKVHSTHQMFAMQMNSDFNYSAELLPCRTNVK